MCSGPSEPDGTRRISLVIPVRNEEGSLPALAESIRAQTRPPDEIILVDGGSSDRTVEIGRRLAAEDARFRLVEAGDATPGRGRNVGIEAATHDWIALTDAGIRLESTWLEYLARVIDADRKIEVVYGNYEPVADTWFEHCAALVYVAPRQLRAGRRMRGPFVASMLLRRDCWRRIGGFPDLRAGEDLIFMEALEASGTKIGWSADATVHWQLQPTLGRTFRRFALYSKHNVWAGRQRFWHYGLARQYIAVLVCVLLGIVHSRWWLLGLPLWLGARVGRNLWRRREGRSLGSLLNPVQFVACAGILLTIDAATFAGWLQALLQRDPSRR